ncbi:NCS2 family permease [Klebsiella pneumoniae]|uniref:NCS2 family permease n=1 Tax=Klebsiella pneumoniae TaxID=573 RepID=A0A6G2BXE2_KLEPN|nr:NCS2 family permease [Klebsiella pneumoniae]
MSQQQTSQSSGQGLLERVFKLREHGTTVRTEAIAGFTTFLTMVYIVFDNPQILGVAGMDTSAVFVTTCLIAAFGSILMGLFANLPVALAPAMGLNAFFAFVVVQAMGLPWQVGMGAIFWGAVGLLLLTIFRVRYWMIANIPLSLRVGITSGIGLFIGMMGLKNAGVIVANPETLVSIGHLTSHSVLLGVLGFFIIAILASRNIHAAVLVSIVVTTLLGWMLGDVHYTGIVSAPPSVASVIGQVDLAGSFIGTSSVTAYIESSSGVSVGGRTGLTAVVVGILFLLVIFLSPLAGMVPGYAAAGALIYVGVLMTSSLARVKWSDLTEAVPAFITAVMMPFSFSITEGIALGFISYCVMKIGTGRLRELSPCVIIVSLLFVLKIVFIDAH